MSKGILYCIIATLLIFMIIPFPLNFVLCVIVGAIIPWVTGNKESKKDVDK